MTIDALLVNWHRPMDDQSIITQKWSQLIDCHWLVLKNLGNPHVPACTYTHSRYAQMFEIWIRSPDCLYVVAWFQKSTTEMHFKTVFWRNTSQQHLLAELFLSLSFILLMSGWYEFLGTLYFHYFLFFQQVLSTHHEDEIIIIWFIRVQFLRIIKCSVKC